MHSPSTLSVLMAIAGLALVGCGKREVSKEKKSTPAALPAKASIPKQPPVTTKVAQPSQSAQPPRAPQISAEVPVLISASVNGSTRPAVTAGWPVVVEVRLFLKPNAGTSLTLSGHAGPWSDALKLECVGPGGINKSSLFLPAYASEKTIELTRARSGMMVWVLDSVALGSLPEGGYQIRVILDEKKLEGAVPAGLASVPVVMAVAPGPETSSPGAAQRKCVAIMTALTWKGDTAKALATGGAYLTDHPKDIAVLCMQGKVQRSQGKKTEALASFETALAAAEENKEPMAENFAIQHVIGELRRELATK